MKCFLCSHRLRTLKSKVNHGLFLLFCFFLSIFVLITISPILFGYEFSIISCDTFSMSPNLDCNDIILIKLFNNKIPTSVSFVNGLNGTSYDMNSTFIKENIKVGDIIVFVEDSNTKISHRVIDNKICEETYHINGVVTKGDNNFYPDFCVPYDFMIGKIVFYLRL